MPSGLTMNSRILPSWVPTNDELSAVGRTPRQLDDRRDVAEVDRLAPEPSVLAIQSWSADTNASLEPSGDQIGRPVTRQRSVRQAGQAVGRDASTT